MVHLLKSIPATTQPSVRNTVEVIYKYPTPTRDCVDLHNNNIDLASNKAAMNSRLSAVCQNDDGTYMRWEIEDFTSVVEGTVADTVKFIFRVSCCLFFILSLCF